jgi:PAS domain-containing protein
MVRTYDAQPRSVKLEVRPMPYRSVTHGQVTLLCFPPYDEAFTRLAMRDLAAGGPDPDALQAQLRALFPHATVRPREPLAALQPGETWYVYRDGRYSPFDDGERWWERPETAWLDVDEAGRYIDANDEALRLLGVERDVLTTLAPGELSDPSVSGLVPWMWELVRETGELHSTSILRARGDRPPTGIEFRLARSHDGIWRSWFRVIPVDGAIPTKDPEMMTQRPVVPVE